MKYFKLINSIEIKEIGHYFQCEDCDWVGGRRDAKDSFSSQGSFGEIIGNPAMPKPIFHKKTKATDYLSVTAIRHSFLVISPRFSNFLTPYINEPYQTWDIVANSKDAEIPYKLLRTNNPKFDFLNWEKSSFCYGEKNYDYDIQMQSPRTSIEIKSHDEFLQKYHKMDESGKFLEVEKWVISTSTFKEDIFRKVFPLALYGTYFVSERLKDAIEANGFTGMSFVPLEEIDKHLDLTID